MVCATQCDCYSTQIFVQPNGIHRHVSVTPSHHVIGWTHETVFSYVRKFCRTKLMEGEQ
jgi:hypothetical protein